MILNLFIDMSSQTGMPSGIPKGHTPPGANPTSSSTLSLGIIPGLV